MPAIVDFQPYMGKGRKPGTGCISQINDHLFEGRYSPTWIDGKKHARNVYAHTREECDVDSCASLSLQSVQMCMRIRARNVRRS